MPNSSFIPNTTLQWAWDATSLTAFKTCPRRYYYSIVCGYRSGGSSIHLRFGGLYHSALELYDKTRIAGADHDEAMRQVVTYLLANTWDRTDEDPVGHPWDTKDTGKNRENLVRTVIWYLEKFREDAAKTIVLDNGKPAIELSFQMALDLSPAKRPDITYTLCGHLDRMVEFLGDPYVMDRKTTKTTVSSYYFQRYDLDNQMSLYTLAGKVIFKTPVKGVIIDAAQIAVGFSRFERGVTHRTPDQLDEWLRDLEQYLRLAEHYAETGNYPMNDTACFLCEFKGVCSKSPQVRQTFLDSDFVKREWDPLVPR